MMAKFEIGDRVKIRINVPSLWDDGYKPRAGTGGTVTHEYSRYGAYGVLLDTDPDKMPMMFSKDEIEAES